VVGESLQAREFADAASYYGEAVSFFEQVGDRREEAACLGMYGLPDTVGLD
jgi:hypothetical protein